MKVLLARWMNGSCCRTCVCPWPNIADAPIPSPGRGANEEDEVEEGANISARGLDRPALIDNAFSRAIEGTRASPSVFARVIAVLAKLSAKVSTAADVALPLGRPTEEGGWRGAGEERPDNSSAPEATDVSMENRWASEYWWWKYCSMMHLNRMQEAK